jgi:carboxylate-amine ligase
LPDLQGGESVAVATPAPIEPERFDEQVAAVRARFSTADPLTVGLEEEVLLVDPIDWSPAPRSHQVVERAADARVKVELPACQVELATRPHRSVRAAVAELAALRFLVARSCDAAVIPVAAAVHPLAKGPCDLVRTDRSLKIASDYGEVAARQLVGSLQVHVAVGDPDSTLAVYNALRGYLPEVAAIAAAAPFHEGSDTGLASVRPLIAGQLPRQGVPPELPSWEAFAEELRWGAVAGGVRDPGCWWWELRPHVAYGTLEVRVPDVQPTLVAAEGVATLVHALVVHLAARHRAGEDLGMPKSWRIAENRWSALRYGLDGHLADLESGRLVPTRDRLAALMELVEPGAPDGLGAARALLDRAAVDDLRAVGIAGALPWMADVFAPADALIDPGGIAP